MLNDKVLNFGRKFIYLGTFTLAFEKSSFVFEIRKLEFVKMQSFVLNKEINLGLKLPYLGFLAQNLK